MAKTLISVKVEPEMRAKIDIIAQYNSISYADAVRMALVDYIQKHERQHGRISAEEINQILLFKKE